MVSLSYKKNTAFYKMLFTISIPIVIQNLISSSLNLVDNVMIGQLGETLIASTGLANQIFFIMTLILFGGNSGISIYIAQFWGKKETDKIKSVLSLGLIFALFVSLIFFMVGFFFPSQVLGLMSQDPEVVKYGTQYIQIVSISYIITAISFTFGFSSRSVGNPKLPMKASVISLLINTGLNYVLIFGHLGFESMGIRGAAIATLIARVVELIIILSGIYRTMPVLAISIKNFFTIEKEIVKKVGKTALPVIFNEAFWSLGMTVYALVYARIGTEAVAAVMITNTVNSIFMVVGFGLGNASSVMLGNTLGAGEIPKAIEYNKRFLALSILCGIVIGLAITLTAPLIVKNLYNLTEESYALTIHTLKVLALFMSFKFYNTIIIIGTLRSGGDTLYSMLLEITCVWLIGVPLAFIGAFVLKLPVYYVVALVNIEEIVKLFLGLPRLLSNKWAKRLV
ncbi:MATE family efflux transporter [Fusibacter bizertensis]|uniref:MATE family efflux transporter n=1 Tax=Fusibacter bizertensis TaxID=1488331 RepID=A0ABT6NA01_9FIRM|nr:MATE family efflux transporter [Fusibacter bizertensis]MDH8677242.1 MATE family efflux transporter [Fusibacter bizertensis]